MKTTKCATCPAKVVDVPRGAWAFCPACRAASAAKLAAEEAARMAQGRINGAATLAAARDAEAALSPETRAAQVAYDRASSESIAQQSAAFHASRIAGEGDHADDARAHCED